MILTPWDVQSKQIHSIDGVCSPICNAEKRWAGISPLIKTYCLQGNMIGRETKNGPQGKGINEGVSFTLNATDRHAIVSIDHHDCVSEGDKTNTLVASEYKDPSKIVAEEKGGNCVYSIGHDMRSARYTPNITDPLTATDYKDPIRVNTESRIRRLTPLECERLQGLPDNWTEGGSDANRYKAIGNGMATPCSDYILKRIAECS